MAKCALWALTMLFILYGWLLFRARSLDQIVAMTRALNDFSAPFWFSSYLLNLALFAFPLLLIEMFQFKRGGYIAPLKLPSWMKGLLQGLLLLGILLFWQQKEVPFIYFQF